MWVKGVALLALCKAVLGSVGILVPVSVARPIPPAVHFAQVAVYFAVGACLLSRGRGDRRAVSLGLFFFLVATSFANPLLASFAYASPRAAPALRLLLNVQVEAYQPYFLWLFARDFPRTRYVGWRKRYVRRMLAATLAVGTLLLLANLAGPRGGSEWMSAFVRDGSGSLYWPVLFALTALALLYTVFQARRADPDERRRVWIVVAGLAVGILPIVSIAAGTVVSASFARYLASTEGVRTLGLLVYPSLLTIPLTTAYAVLVHRALELRTIVRGALRYALARHTLVLAAVLPFAAALGLVYTHRNDRVADLGSGTAGLLMAAAAVAGVMLSLRGPLLAALDRRFFRDEYDARVILRELVERIRVPRNAGELERLLAHELGRALHVCRVSLFLATPDGAGFATPARNFPPLPHGSSVARRLEADPWPLNSEIPLGAPFTDDSVWLADTDMRLLVPVTAYDGSLLAILGLGEKRSELPYTADDRVLLSTVANAAAMVLESRRMSALTPPAEGDEDARECSACGVVMNDDVECCVRCGGETVAAPVPPMLAGKFRILARIGRGGMGVVYRATDGALNREVAIKTLPRMLPSEAAALRKEARSMAAVSHPNLALIFGAESWRGTPLLVVEYLQGGTLGERIAEGALTAMEAVAAVGGVAAGLARLHGSGILHRDIKPSNIGFAGDGTPKLLDFGLARALDAAQYAEHDRTAWSSPDRPGSSRFSAVDSAERDGGGTLLYLSPELVSGEPADASSDLWALCMVLYESLAGRHPFALDAPHWALVRIAEADVPDVRELAPGVPEPVAELLRAALHPDPRRRPASARELEHRLRGLLTSC